MSWTCTCGSVNQDRERFCSRCGAPGPSPSAPPRPEDATAPFPDAPGPPHPPYVPPIEPPPAPPPSSKKKFLVIGSVAAVVLLLGACIIAIVAAIAIPAIIKSRDNSKERAKQARAMEDMRKIAEVVQDYGDEKGVYPNWGERKGGYNLRYLQELWAILPAQYGIRVQTLTTDPWKNPYKYAPNATAKQFIVVCQGSDGLLQLDNVPDKYVGTHCFENDIVWHNDGFIQSPQGEQKKCTGK